MEQLNAPNIKIMSNEGESCKSEKSFKMRLSKALKKPDKQAH
jgi:hypothetical protein